MALKTVNVGGKLEHLLRETAMLLPLALDHIAYCSDPYEDDHTVCAIEFGIELGIGAAKEGKHVFTWVERGGRVWYFVAKTEAEIIDRVVEQNKKELNCA